MLAVRSAERAYAGRVCIRKRAGLRPAPSNFPAALHLKAAINSTDILVLFSAIVNAFKGLPVFSALHKKLKTAKREAVPAANTGSPYHKIMQRETGAGRRMYPYHNKIKQRIRAGELVGYEYVWNYPRIGQALVLYFSTSPQVRPIRPYRYAEYEPLLAQWEAGEKNQTGERGGHSPADQNRP